MSHPISGRERDVRFREEFELRCTMCQDWWPITTEFWQPKNGMQRCKACWREYHRIKQRVYSADERHRLATHYRNRINYAEHREARRAANHAWKMANRERVAEYNRAYRERKRAA